MRNTTWPFRYLFTFLFTAAQLMLSCSGGEGIHYATFTGHAPLHPARIVPLRISDPFYAQTRNDDALYVAYRYYDQFLSYHVDRHGRLNYLSTLAPRGVGVDGLHKFLAMVGNRLDLDLLKKADAEKAVFLRLNSFNAFALDESLNYYWRGTVPYQIGAPFFFIVGTAGSDLPQHTYLSNGKAQITNLATLAATLENEGPPEIIFAMSAGRQVSELNYDDPTTLKPLLLDRPYGFDPRSGTFLHLQDELNLAKETFYQRSVTAAATALQHGNSFLIPEVMRRYESRLLTAGNKKPANLDNEVTAHLQKFFADQPQLASYKQQLVVANATSKNKQPLLELKIGDAPAKSSVDSTAQVIPSIPALNEPLHLCVVGESYARAGCLLADEVKASLQQFADYLDVRQLIVGVASNKRDRRFNGNTDVILEPAVNENDVAWREVLQEAFIDEQCGEQIPYYLIMEEQKGDWQVTQAICHGTLNLQAPGQI